MKTPGAFHFEDVLPETKAIYGLTVDSVGDMEGMEDEVLLNVCRLATEKAYEPRWWNGCVMEICRCLFS